MNYDIVHTPLGQLMVAANERGITWVGFGHSGDSVMREFRADLPDVELIHDQSAMHRFVGPIAEFLDGSAPFPTLPLAPIGTEFQRRVWDQLVAIPTGATLAYSEIASRIGRPDAIRAVGAAVGANPISILIPCHRAVTKDGRLHNYRYGLARKRALLELEGAPILAANPIQLTFAELHDSR
jgi:AraC family transcriptional regulator, regulatory protein of adaptative response / methylated-DNA-[protein]-cysteine methyltransferase